MAKSFKKNPAINFLTENNKNTQEVQEVSEAQKEQEVQEVKKTRTSKDTQGRKGEKLPRMNMGFFGNNLEYIQKMSRLRGMTMTEYLNELIDIDKEKNKEILEHLEKLEKFKRYMD